MAKVHALKVGKLYRIITPGLNIWKNQDATNPVWIGVIRPGNPLVFLDLNLTDIQDSILFNIYGPTAVIKVIWKDLVGHTFVSYENEFKSDRYFQRFRQ